MIRQQFELLINKRSLSADFSWLPELAKIINRKFSLQKEISVALASEGEIKKLNKIYRHKNKVTDVLSFIISSPQILGEVIICLSQAKRQAKAAGHSLRRELQVLTIHGILHLLGYDHERSKAEAKRQEKLEKIILAQLNK